ncbi:MAG: hypothetical protein ACREH8_21785 [Opitutaceae bacterium]
MSALALVALPGSVEVVAPVVLVEPGDVLEDVELPGVVLLMLGLLLLGSIERAVVSLGESGSVWDEVSLVVELLGDVLRVLPYVEPVPEVELVGLLLNGSVFEVGFVEAVVLELVRL